VVVGRGMTSERGVGGSRGELDVEVDERVRVGVVLDCDAADGKTYQHASEATHTSMSHKFGIIGSAVVLYCGTAPRRSAARGGDGKVTSNSALTALATAPLQHSLQRLYSTRYRAFTALFTAPLPRSLREGRLGCERKARYHQNSILMAARQIFAIHQRISAAPTWER
jgi:hypothetical protein